MSVRLHLVAGEAPGLPLMRFTLIYQGELRSNDDYRRKWAIRSQFHPQLAELWRTSPALKAAQRYRHLPQHGWWMIDSHHSIETVGSPPRSG
jgi:hypothetical protein